MTKKTKVSVVLTSYNHAKYLAEAIDSVLNQTFTDFELIIWDDASTDTSWDIISSYQDTRIRAYRNETNQIVEGVRKAISEVAIGDYIAIHHSDDVWESQKLEMQVAFLDKNPQIAAVFSNAKIINEEGSLFSDEGHFYYNIFDQPNRNRYEWLNYFFTQGNALCHPSILIRKECYEEIGLYRSGLVQTPDFDMWVRLCMKYEIYVLPEKLIQFRIRTNEANASGSRLDNNVRSQFEYFQVLDNYRQLSSYEEISKIFPVAEKYYRADGFDSQFVLGMIALEVGTYKFTELFGLQLLFEALNNPTRAKKIKDLYDFDILKFLQLTGSHDVFSFGLREQADRELSKALQVLNERIAEREEAVSILNNRIAEREESINILNDRVAEREKAIQILNERAAEREENIASLSIQINEHKNIISILNRDLKALGEKTTSLEQVQSQLESIYKSRSWKIASRLQRVWVMLLAGWRLPVTLLRKLINLPSLGRLKDFLKKYRDMHWIRRSGLFDEVWYLDNNPDIAKSGINPLFHYLKKGGYEGRDPSPHFDSDWYLLTYPDVKISGENPLINYLRAGRAEGRNAQDPSLDIVKNSGLFDAKWYLSAYPDVANSHIDPLLHFVRNGGFEGRDPGPQFNSNWYLKTYKDAMGSNPLLHYLQVGRAEGRLTQDPDFTLVKNSGFMDEQWYLSHNPDVAAAKMDPLWHFIKYGGLEGRDPGPKFSISAYLDVVFEDIKQAKINPLVHYLKHYPWDASRLETGDGRMKPTIRRPLVSIVIPVYNAVDMTRACVESIYRETKGIPFEVIIVDNASQDGTAEYLDMEKQNRPYFYVVSMPQNIGFGPAVNEGMQRSKSEYVVILNNDTMVSPNWLKHLLAPFEKDAFIGITSPVTNYVGEGPQIDMEALEMPPDDVRIREHAASIAERTEIFIEPNRLVFFCVAIRRELIDIIGYLDPGYEKGNFEDDDYCLRTRMAGYRLAIAKNAFVYHHGSFTFKSNKISHNWYMEKNRGRFYRKAGRIATTLKQNLPDRLTTKHEVSVILRTKDRPLLLQKAMTSLASQTFRDFEVVLVNDGGVDVSGLVNLFKPQFPIQYVYHPTSKGRTAAVNAGIYSSTGRWITYLDDDDILYPWHLETLFQATGDGKHKFVYSDYNQALFLDMDAVSPTVLKGMPPREYDRRVLLVQNYIPIHTWLHARECAEKAGAWDETLDRLEDYEFLLRVSENYSFQHVRKVTCEYRYYLSGANSIYSDRRRSMQALEHIYKRYPVADSELQNERQNILVAIEKQINKIEEIRSQIGTSITEDRAVREIIKLVANI